jgi:tRNA threonylcarbamoyladenosine biosynthesis protein TsaE
MRIRTNSIDETRRAGADAAARASAGETYGLSGELGAGKTEFVRGFVAALDSSAGVRSPTFTLVNIYETPRFPVYHFDFYRLKSAAELVEIGFYEYTGGDGVCLIEWAGMFPDALPENTRMIRFAHDGETGRIIEFD